MNKILKAPFPYFGGKSKVGAEVWRRFGKINHYIEPFFGSGAVLFQGPSDITCTVNDFDAMVSNFWRAVKNAPDEVARHADWPVNEVDLCARHLWLVGQKDQNRMSAMADAECIWFSPGCLP